MTGSQEEYEELQRRLAMIQVGAAYANCCHLDLYTIDTEQEVEELRETLQSDFDANEFGCSPMIFPSLKDGLEYYWKIDIPDRPAIEKKLRAIT